jgi:hypothetical protein
MVDAAHLKVHRIVASLKRGELFLGTLDERKRDSAASYMPFAMALGDRWSCC